MLIRKAVCLLAGLDLCQDLVLAQHFARHGHRCALVHAQQGNGHCQRTAAARLAGAEVVICLPGLDRHCRRNVILDLHRGTVAYNTLDGVINLLLVDLAAYYDFHKLALLSDVGFMQMLSRLCQHDPDVHGQELLFVLRQVRQDLPHQRLRCFQCLGKVGSWLVSS